MLKMISFSSKNCCLKWKLRYAQKCKRCFVSKNRCLKWKLEVRGNAPATRPRRAHKTIGPRQGHSGMSTFKHVIFCRRKTNKHFFYFINEESFEVSFNKNTLYRWKPKTEDSVWWVEKWRLQILWTRENYWVELFHWSIEWYYDRAEDDDDMWGALSENMSTWSL